MSYCRFGWDGSNVYVFEGGDEDSVYWECCGCSLRGAADKKPIQFKDRQSMIVHLMDHRRLGDNVPQFAIDRLEEEIKTGKSYWS